jgi:hypothetical protein
LSTMVDTLVPALCDRRLFDPSTVDMLLVLMARFVLDHFLRHELATNESIEGSKYFRLNTRMRISV